MKGILSLGIQDFKRLLTNALFWVLTVTLIVIILVVNFALPGKLDMDDHEIVTYNLTGFDLYARALGSEDAVFEAVKNGNAIGIIGESDGLTIVHPNLSEKMLNSLLLPFTGMAPQELTVEFIKEIKEPVPFNKSMVPILICFEALITGVILGGALMLAEKEDGTVNALRIAPVGAFKYLMSKTILFSIIGTLYAALICLFCIGFSIAWVPFLLLSFSGTAIFTLMGLAFTTLFKDMSSWFFSITLLLTINMLPVISYSSPSFAPLWIKLIPSYPILFSFNKAFFGGDINALYTIGVLAVWCFVACIAAHIMIRKLFLKGGRN